LRKRTGKPESRKGDGGILHRNSRIQQALIALRSEREGVLSILDHSDELKEKKRSCFGSNRRAGPRRPPIWPVVG